MEDNGNSNTSRHSKLFPVNPPTVLTSLVHRSTVVEASHGSEGRESEEECQREHVRHDASDDAQDDEYLGLLRVTSTLRLVS